MRIFELALTSIVLLSGCVKAEPTLEKSAPPNSLACFDVEIGRSQGVPLNTLDPSTSYCLEFNSEKPASSAKVRIFKRQLSGALVTMDTLDTRLSIHKMKDGKYAVVARSISALIPIGFLDDQKALIEIKKSDESSGESFVATVKLPSGKTLVVTQPKVVASAQQIDMAEYGLDGAKQFENNEYPVRGFADYLDYKFVIDLVPSLSRSFSSDQRGVAYSAVRAYTERGFRQSTLECTQKKSGSNFPFGSVDEFRRVFVQLAPGIDLNGVRALIPIYVVPISGIPETPGLSFLNNFSFTTNTYPSLPRRTYFYIALNGQYLGSNSISASGANVDYWAGVVGRLFLQNLGYSDVNTEENNFLLAYQECVQFYGVEK
jgi:hypothetical protein